MSVNPKSSSFPVPFFQVLLEEHLALHEPERLAGVSWENTVRDVGNWKFTVEHFSRSLQSLKPAERSARLRELAAKLKPLLNDSQAQIHPGFSEHEVIDWLNRLVECGRCLWNQKDFPKDEVRAETRKLSEIPLRQEELPLANRLLLEDLFRTELRRVYDLHLAKVYNQIHRRARSHGVQGLQTALCLSGGGIRSATFALGVLQGLARRELLPRFQYLSTVSGGGYIGSWLSSWIHHEGAERVFEELKGVKAASPTEPEPRPLRHLRMFSNYLTPRLGAFSADTWTLIGTYLRNLFLNWLIFIPLLLALLAVPRVYVSLLQFAPPTWLLVATFFLGAAGAICAIAYSALNRPGILEKTLSKGSFWGLRRRQSDFLRWCLAPLCLSALCLCTFWLWIQNHENALTVSGLGVPGIGRPEPLFYIAFGLALHIAAWLVAEIWLRRFHLGEFVTVVLTGALGGFFLWLAARLTYVNCSDLFALEWHACLALPTFLLLFATTASIFIGLLSRNTSDEDREWWARMGAWILIVVVAWLLFSALVLFGPWLLISIPVQWAKGILVSAGGLAGVLTLWMGGSSGTGAKATDQARTGWRSWLLKLTTPLTIGYIITALAVLSSWAILSVTKASNAGANEFTPLANYLEIVHETPLLISSLFCVVAASAGFLFSRPININKFSIHAIYRSRLIRAYLGASNPSRRPNPFTGFDLDDNLRLQHLRDAQNPALPQRPLHVVNMALNLVGGENLAWQQRKAETFIASPLYCGNFRLGFRRSEQYARSAKYPERGLSLGTAVAVSGAAASPNQGYHSSSLVALLMTFFNVRLGWWLGNPGLAGHDTFCLSAPNSPVLHMIKEGLGMTDSRSRYIYLSDGGHFENLGLYEMVLRRAHLVVLSDAGCDPKCSLDDLGNAIRKIRVDLGVKIEIKKFGILSRRNEVGEAVGKYCAIGEIDYCDVDGREAVKGTLVYFKPVIYGRESQDIYNYAAEHEHFPHETTGDQWFSESQFESYRRLGLHAVDHLYSLPASELKFKAKAEKPDAMAEFIARVCHHGESEPLPECWRDLFELPPEKGSAQSARTIFPALASPAKEP